MDDTLHKNGVDTRGNFYLFYLQVKRKNERAK